MKKQWFSFIKPISERIMLLVCILIFVNLQMISADSLDTNKAAEPNTETVLSGICGENASWTLDENGLLTISGSGEMDPLTYTPQGYVFPDNEPAYPYAQVKALRVEEGITKISDNAFARCSQLTEVSLPKSLRTIGKDTFRECGFTSIQLPEQLKTIGHNAFCNCKNLTSIVIPDSVKAMGDYVFAQCLSLKSVVLSNQLTQLNRYSFRNCTSLTDIQIPESITSLGNNCFESCTSLVNITIPDSVTNIGKCAFMTCRSLKSIALPNSLTEINERTFRQCESLSEIDIPSSVTTIGVDSFASCNSLIELTIPEGVTTISGKAFYKCLNLISVTFSSSLTTIGGNAFQYCLKLNKVTIPDHVSVVEWYAFDDTSIQEVNCIYTDYSAFANLKEKLSKTIPASARYHVIANGKEITQMSIPNGVTAIDSHVFAGCSSLKRIVIPASVNAIGEGAFENCTSLTGISVPEGAADIGNQAFAGCTGLTSVTIPDSVKTIGERAFSGCTSLTGITIPGKIQEIGNGTFSGCRGLTSVVIPEMVKTIGSNAFENCTKLSNVTFSGSSLQEIQSGAFSSCSALTQIELPQSLKSIGEEAFSKCGSIEKLTISDLVSTIGRSAFSGTSIEKVYCGYSDYNHFLQVKTELNREVGASADYHLMANGKEMVQIIIPDGTQRIEDRLFMKCCGLGSVTIPMGVEEIGADAFWNASNLKTVVIPNSMSFIAYGAFTGTAIEKVYYYGNEETWSLIRISTSNVPLLKAPREYLPCITILQQPQNITVNDGDVTEFSIKATGSGLKYQWYYQLAGSEGFTRWSGRTASSFKYTLPFSKNGMKLYCEIKDSTGLVMKSDIITVTVNERMPEILVQPESVIVNEGETVNFNVQASGNGLKYQWYYKLAGSKDFSLWTGRTAPSFNYVITANKNGMELYCEVTNSSGNTVRTDVITVMVNVSKPVILQQPSDVTIGVGETTTFSVKASGSGLTYQWYYKMAGDAAFTKWSNRTTSSFNFTGAASKNGMQVYCIVKNAAGQEVKSNVVTLTVKANLAITRQPVDVTVKEGETTRISVEASGTGLTYQWYYKMAGASAFTKWSNRTTSGFNFTCAASKNGMEIYCVVSDCEGRSVTSQIMTLTVLPKA